MSELFRLLQDQKRRTVAIVGMTKNVGKTVTLNHLVKEFEKKGDSIGLVSAGYDGERVDRLTLKEKPRIYAPPGAVVATAEACFNAADARLEFLEAGSASTPLGVVYLARVLESGLVELAGPGSISGLTELIRKMYSYGSESVLVDGAINRIASASPLVTEGTVLATGASLGPTMDDVIKKTVFRRELFETEKMEDELFLTEARASLKDGNAALINYCNEGYSSESVRAPIPLLAGSQVVDKCKEGTAALVFGGALVDSLLESILKLFTKPPLIIVQDATRLFISADTYYRFKNRGGEIQVMDKLNLIAVTLNPSDPNGRGYEPGMFLEKMKEALNPCPVFDIVYET